MKQSILIILSAMSLFVYTSCEKIVGEGPVVSQTRNVSNFKSVSISVSGTINYTMSPTYNVEILAQQNILDVMQTNLVGDQLVIKFKDGVRVKDHDNIVINISAPYANGISLSGSAEVKVAGTINTTDCELRVSGSGNITVANLILSNKLYATISGSGNITVNTGTAKEEELQISGSGNIDLANVIAEKAETHISGSGDMHVNLSQILDATISGSGSVFYRGTPQVSTHISGSGRVVPF